MSFGSIGSIAVLVTDRLNLTGGVSGTMVAIVDNARINVQNFTGATIGSNSIEEKFQHAITNFAMADAIDSQQGQSGGNKVSLDDLSMDDAGDSQFSAEGFRKIAESALKYLGRKIGFEQVLV